MPEGDNQKTPPPLLSRRLRCSTASKSRSAALTVNFLCATLFHVTLVLLVSLANQMSMVGVAEAAAVSTTMATPSHIESESSASPTMSAAGVNNIVVDGGDHNRNNSNTDDGALRRIRRIAESGGLNSSPSSLSAAAVTNERIRYQEGVGINYNNNRNNHNEEKRRRRRRSPEGENKIKNKKQQQQKTFPSHDVISSEQEEEEGVDLYGEEQDEPTVPSSVSSFLTIRTSATPSTRPQTSSASTLSASAAAVGTTITWSTSSSEGAFFVASATKETGISGQKTVVEQRRIIVDGGKFPIG